MREFWKILKRYSAPYKSCLVWAVILNILSAVFNIFSFTLIIPILNILFKIDTKVYEFIPWESAEPFKEKLLNNLYFYVGQWIEQYGASTTLLLLGLFLGVMTFLKTSCYFGSSAVMIPLRTGVVRDLRVQVYNKVLSLPMGFFSQQKKGDIIARMSGDVGTIEWTITSSLDMLIKNPILILFYFGTLLYTSWQLTVFTVCVVPLMAWGMSVIGKKLRSDSLEAQAKWSDTMSQLDETLGGLRIIKAFIAEDKMKDRFEKICNDHRKSVCKVATRQASAHLNDLTLAIIDGFSIVGEAVLHPELLLVDTLILLGLGLVQIVEYNDLTDLVGIILINVIHKLQRGVEGQLHTLLLVDVEQQSYSLAYQAVLAGL